MTEDNQHNAGEQQTPMQPQPLPGQVFVRPGIDDRPDYEKTLTEETKAALKRLAVQQNPRVPEASNERPEVQQTLINTESGSPLTAFAHLDAAVPNLESSFLDLRDPMTAPDGTTPTKPQVHRLTAGFALGALLFTAPMAALNSVLIPQTISRLSGTDRVTDLALLSVVGTLLTFRPFVLPAGPPHPVDHRRHGADCHVGGDSFRMRFHAVGHRVLAVHADRTCDGIDAAGGRFR